jgi:4-hydroxythreonine-4-phosphate dehydrogenase
VPLHHSTLWSIEANPAPSSIADALAPLQSGLVTLATVRGTPIELAQALRVLAEQNLIAVCDAESVADLEAIAFAALQTGALVAGSSALGAAVGRLTQHSPAPTPEALSTDSGPTTTPILLVLGTASEQGRDQLKVLAESGVTVIPLNAAAVLAGTIDLTSLSRELATGPVAVHLDNDPAERVESAPLGQAFARLLAPFTARHRLFLSGGATARAVLDAAGVRWLEPIAEIEHGAVMSRTDLNTLIVTRPGSFGAPDSLVTITDFLQSFVFPPHSDAIPQPEMDIS